MWDVRHVPKYIICHKAFVVITKRAHCFRYFLYYALLTYVRWALWITFRQLYILYQQSIIEKVIKSCICKMIIVYILYIYNIYVYLYKSICIYIHVYTSACIIYIYISIYIYIYKQNYFLYEYISEGMDSRLFCFAWWTSKLNSPQIWRPEDIHRFNFVFCLIPSRSSCPEVFCLKAIQRL